MGVLDKYVQGSTKPASTSGSVSSGGGVLGKYLGGTSSGGTSDWYDPENYAKRMAYYGGKYQEQKPYIDKATGQPYETVKAKYYKEKLASDLLGSKEGLTDIAKQAGLEVPKKKESWWKKLTTKGGSTLSRLSDLLSAGETGNVAYEQIKAGKEGKGFGNIEALKKYAGDIKKGVKGESKDKKTYKDVLELLGMKTHKLSDVAPSLFNETGKGIFKLKKGGIADVSDTGALGTLGDILLDPTTYLTAGTGGAAKAIATKGGKKALNKSGVKFLKKAAEQFSEGKGVRAGLEKAEKMLATAIERKPEQFAKYLDKGGLKFMGQTIPGLSSKNISKLGDITGATKIKEAVRKSTPVQTLAKAFKRDVRGDATKEQFEKLTNILQTDYHDKLAYGNEQTLNTLSDLFGGKGLLKRGKIKPKQRAEISRSILEGNIEGLSEELRPVANKVKNIFDTIAKKEKKAGILDKTREDYVTQLYQDPKKAKQVASFFKSQPTATTRFSKERTIDTVKDIPKLILKDDTISDKQALDILFNKKGTLGSGVTYKQARQEIKKAGLTPKLDIAEILGVRSKASNEALSNQELYQKLGKEFGVKSDMAKLGDDLVDAPSKHMGKDVKVPRFVADKIDDLEKRSINDEGLKEVLRGWNKVQNFYKKNLTSLFPSFHARNAFSNVAQNFLDIGLDAANPKTGIQAIKALRGGKGIVKTKLGKYSYDEIKDLMARHGITSSGFFEGEFKGLQDKIGATYGQKGRQKFAQTAGKGYRKGQQIGQAIESQARAVNFLSNLKKGLSPEDAAARTKKFLFDYDNLSNFEKDVVRSAIPFYTWSRKNIELQTKMLKEAPGKVGAEMKMLRNVGEPITEEDREGLPDFVQEQAGVKMGKDKYGRPVYYSGFGLPIEQFAKTLSDPKKEFFGMLSPLLKSGIELQTGKDLFREKDIKDVNKAEDVNFILDQIPNEKAKQKLKDYLDVKEVEKAVYVKGEKVGTRKSYTADPMKLWALRQMPFNRIQASLGYVGDEGMETTQKLQKLLSGIRGYSFDEEEQKFFKNREAIEKLQELLEKEGIMGKGATGQHYLKEQEKYLEPYINKKTPTKYGGFLARNY